MTASKHNLNEQWAPTLNSCKKAKPTISYGEDIQPQLGRDSSLRERMAWVQILTPHLDPPARDFIPHLRHENSSTHLKGLLCSDEAKWMCAEFLSSYHNRDSRMPCIDFLPSKEKYWVNECSSTNINWVLVSQQPLSQTKPLSWGDSWHPGNAPEEILVFSSLRTLSHQTGHVSFLSVILLIIYTVLIASAVLALWNIVRTF